MYLGRRLIGLLCSLMVLFCFVFWLCLYEPTKQQINMNNKAMETRKLVTNNKSASKRETRKLVTNNKSASTRESIAGLEKELPNIPLTYLYDNKDKKFDYENKPCGKLPSISEIHFNNIYWQETLFSIGTFYLYAAYLDVRRPNTLGPTIRILGMIDSMPGRMNNVKAYCLMWFDEDKEPVVSKVVDYRYAWFGKWWWHNYKPGLLQPYLLACQLPKSHWQETPISVSIVERICDTATNNLKVIYNKEEKKKDFAVCVKGLSYSNDDVSMSARLIEWFELLSLQGADKVFLYLLDIHPNILKMLEYYAKKGMVDLTPTSLPSHQPNMKFLLPMFLKHLKSKHGIPVMCQIEVIHLHDCMYRNMYRYKYIAALDPDEVIMPQTRQTWVELMQDISLQLKDKSKASYNFRNVYFMDEMTTANLNSDDPINISDIPEYMHMLRHVYRSAQHTDVRFNIKAFHNTDKVLIIHNHYPLECLDGPCQLYDVDISLAHMPHYRADCVEDIKKDCYKHYKKRTVKDTTIWKYKQQLIERSTEALDTLGLLQ